MKKSTILFSSLILLSIGLTSCLNIKKDEEKPNIHTHSFKEEVVNPTCTEKGYTLHKCECGEEYKDTYVNELGHSFAWIIDKEATKKEEGLKHEKCGRCDAIRNEDTSIPILECLHEKAKKVEGTPATCLEPGVKDYWSCEECDRFFADEQCSDEVVSLDEWKVIPAKGHHFGDPVYEWEDGVCTAKRTCEYDETHVEKEESVGVYEVDTDATCEQSELGHLVATFSNPAFEPQQTPANSVDSGNYGSHIFGDDNLCNECGSSKGVQYALNNDGISFSVVGLSNDFSGTKVVIAESFNSKPVTSIADDAFKNNGTIETVQMPSSIITIGKNAFENCTKLTSINLSNNLVNILDYAFQGSGLSEITIPKSVKNINKDAFNINSLKRANYLGTIDDWVSINFGSYFANPTYSAHNLFIDGKLLTRPAINAKEIKDYSLGGCCSLVSITLGEDVESLSSSAFNLAYNIIEVVNLSQLDFSKSSFGLNNFALKTDSSDIIEKDGYLFYEIEGVKTLVGYEGTQTDLVLPDAFNGNPYPIKDRTFISNKLITSVDLNGNVTKVGINCFESSTVENVDFTGVTEIGSRIFGSAKELKSLVIPSTVKSVGQYLAMRCSNLETLEFDADVEIFPDLSVYECASLNTLKIGSKVTTLGTLSIYNCPNLKNLTILGNITTIENNVFYNCNNLENVVIPQTVYNAISKTNLKSVTITHGHLNDNEFTNSEFIKGSFTINTGETTIGVNALSGCSKLEEITIPSSIKAIKNNAFKDCTSLTKVTFLGTIEDWVEIEFSNEWANPLFNGADLYINNELVTSVSIENAVKIGNYSFNNYKKLTSVTLGDSVKSIGNYAFADTLTSVEIGSNVETIGSYAFYKNPIDSITLPDTLTAIGSHTFELSNIKNVYGANNLHAIGAYAFYKCPLESIPLSISLTTIGSYCFSETKLETVNIPDSVQTLGESAFELCKSLITLNIGSGLKVIPKRAFYKCSSVKNLSLGSIEVINEDAFAYLDSLNEVIIPDSVLTLDVNCFDNCMHLYKVTLGSSLSYCRISAFAHCERIAVIVNYSSLFEKDSEEDYAFVFRNVIDILTEPSGEITKVDGFVFYEGKTGNYAIDYTGNDINVVTPPDYKGGTYKINRYLFYGTNIQTVVISDGVTYCIGDAFVGCNHLCSITLGKGLTSAPDVTLFGEPHHISEFINLSNFSDKDIVPGWNGSLVLVHSSPQSKIVTTADGYKFIEMNDSRYLIDYVGSERDLILPNDYNGEKYKVRQFAFENSNLTSVVIPDNITSIGRLCFHKCQSLIRIIFGNGIEDKLGAFSFYYCANLFSIYLGSVNINDFYSSFGPVDYAIPEVINGDATSNLHKVGDFWFYVDNGVNYLMFYTGDPDKLVYPDDFNGESYSIHESFKIL